MSCPSFSGPHCWETRAWDDLRQHVETINATHLRNLLRDPSRCKALTAEFDGIFLDYSRQRVTGETMELLCNLAQQTGLKAKISAMATGERINVTENRAVLHMALRVPLRPKQVGQLRFDFAVDGHMNAATEVLRVRRKVRDYTQRIRSGACRGVTGRILVDVVSIGIGGSYLGPEFVYEALRTEPRAALAAAGRRLRFLANVDPSDVARALEGLNPETTLVVVISKTFTTAETMLNARTVRRWLLEGMRRDGIGTSSHARIFVFSPPPTVYV